LIETAVRFVTLAILCALVLSAMASATVAQQSADAEIYPSRTIRMIVPFPPGGPVDTIARIVGQKMSEHWHEPVVIENRAGGNTAIGAELVAKSPADGYTLLVAMDVTMVMNPLVMKDLPYEPLRDLAPVTLLNKSISLVTVRSDGPKTIAELIAKAKAHPNTLNMGAGTITSRLGALAFAKAADIDVALVPFKGSIEITQALLSGAVDFTLDSVANALPLIRAGKFRALAKYGDRALPVLPDVPGLSIAAGLPGIGESSSWIALVAPRATPKPVIDKLAREVAQIFADQTLAARLRDAGLFAESSTPEQLETLIRGESERWKTLIGTGIADKILN
jgi:tripartite-type tricarboxylate transporter receptor subunit TctC